MHRIALLALLLTTSLLHGECNQQRKNLTNPGGPPDIEGTFIGESFVGFIASSGFVVLEYDASTSGSITTTYGRYSSWECLPRSLVPEGLRNMSVSRTVYDAVKYDQNGVIVSSGTFCNLYVVDLDTQWTTGSPSPECPPSSRLENAFVQREDAFINTQIVNATLLPQPKSLVCGGSEASSNATSPVNTPTVAGPGLEIKNGTIFAVNTTLSGFPSSSRVNSTSFPPEIVGESIALSSYVSNNVTVEVQTLEVTNGGGYGLIALTAIEGLPQRFSSAVARGISYRYLEEPSFIQLQQSTVFVDQNVSATKYDELGCSLIQLDTESVYNYTSIAFLNGSSVCPRPNGVVSKKNTTDVVSVTKLVNFPIQGAVNASTAYAYAQSLGSPTTEPPSSLVFEFYMRPEEWSNGDSSIVMYYSLNIKSAVNVTMAQIHRSPGASSGSGSPVVLELVPTASGWPTRTEPFVQGNKAGNTSGKGSLSRLGAPISGSYLFQGLFTQEDLRGPMENATMLEFIEQVVNATPGEFFVNVRTETKPYGEARGSLVWTKTAGDGSGDTDGSVDGVIEAIEAIEAILPPSPASPPSIISGPVTAPNGQGDSARRITLLFILCAMNLFN
jgi:hypothetical protein